MKKIVMMLFVIMALGARAEDNRLGLGGYYKLSKYIGGENKLYPFVNVSYDKFYLQGSEIGYSFDLNEVEVTPFVKKDSTEGFEKGELTGSNALLETRENPMLAGVKVSKKIDNLDLSLSGYRDFSSEGNNIKLKAAYTLKIFEFLYFLPSASAVYSDKNYVNYYYGMTAEESALTGGEYKNLNGSIRGEFELGAAMFFSQKAGVYFSYNVEALNGHNYNHSLIKHMANKSFTLMGMYRF